MESLKEFTKPSKEERRLAMESVFELKNAIQNLKTDIPEIEIEETGKSIKIPLNALKFLVEILESMKKGLPISIVPRAAELTTQKAADFLGCSRPHLVKLLENGKIPFELVGRHRRVKFNDLLNYKNSMKEQQKEALINLMNKTKEASFG